MLRSTVSTAHAAWCAMLLFSVLQLGACADENDPQGRDAATHGDGDDHGHDGGGAAGPDAGTEGNPDALDAAAGGGSSGSALGPTPVVLGSAGAYAILAKSAISTVPTSKVTGDLGLSPAAASYITGFALTKAGTAWTSTQVVGSVFAADNDAPTPANLTSAVSDMQTAYTDAAGRPSPILNMGGGAIGGLTLVPGLYKWTTTVTVPEDVTLSGAADDVWIFQITGDLKMSAAKRMVLSGGAQAKHVFWQVAGRVELGSQAHAEGVVLSKTTITLATGASINGRLLAQTAVNIAGSVVTTSAP